MSLRKFRFFIYLILFIFLFLTVERLCHEATDGFAITRITYPSILEENRETTDLAAIQLILNQPFTYLDCGAQCYAFASEDDQYVIKLFKFHHLRLLPILEKLPLLPFLKKYKDQKITKKRLELHKHLESYRLAYTSLKDETNLVYLHLNHTTQLKQLHLIDKIGIRYDLNANNLPFIIQKKGDLFYTKLKKAISAKNQEEAVNLITSVLKISMSRCLKGIADKDPDLATNFGVINNTTFQLDVGRFYLKENEKDPQIYYPELLRITSNLKNWLLESDPSLAAYLEQELTKLSPDSQK